MRSAIIKRLGRGDEVFLVLTQGRAFLAGREAVFKKATGAGPSQFLVMDLQKAWRGWQRTAGADMRRIVRVPDVLELTGLTRRMLMQWTSAGHIRPVKAGSKGRGRAGLYTVGQAFVLGVAWAMRSKRATPGQVAYVFAALTEKPKPPKPTREVVEAN